MSLFIKRHFINGQWVKATGIETLPIIDPATALQVGDVSLATNAELDQAIAAAKAAFKSYSNTDKQQRLSWLSEILALYKKYYDDFAMAIMADMGAPIKVAREEQAYTGIEHFESTIKSLKSYDFETKQDGYHLRHEAVGVCGLITPWNWPINQIACKVAPALAAGCTMVFKGCEFSPRSSDLFAEIINQSSLPRGVFNFVQGDGKAGAYLSSHEDIDMVSFTGSTTAGIAVAEAAAPTVKRVSQELGGKSPIIVMGDVDIEAIAMDVVMWCMHNSGQSCNNGTRLLIHKSLRDKAYPAIKAAVESLVVGDPNSEKTDLGPLANSRQYEKVSAMIKRGLGEGYEVLIGGVGKPEGCTQGFYVMPTVFVDMPQDAFLVQEEVFGPVLTVQTFDDVEEAITLANDSLYGLSSYIYANDHKVASHLAKNMRAGMVHINGAMLNPDAPFGGYKMSGNGREWGVSGVEEFLEVKALMGMQ